MPLYLTAFPADNERMHGGSFSWKKFRKGASKAVDFGLKHADTVLGDDYADEIELARLAKQALDGAGPPKRRAPPRKKAVVKGGAKSQARLPAAKLRSAVLRHAAMA